MKKYPVAITRTDKIFYPQKPPFNPSVIYPEFKKVFPENSVDISNHVYPLVRESFLLLHYDDENYNTTEWNPLGWLIKQGETIFLKPNMISEKHRLNDDWDYVITHGSVIRAVIDYVFLALKGKGRVIIGDAPQPDSKFTKIIELMGLKEIRDFYKNYRDFALEIINLQDEHWVEKNGIYVETVKLPGDPKGSIVVDLARDSLFAEHDGLGKRYYGAFYDTEETNIHHKDGKHEYTLARTPIAADVFINLPKLKTHKKCGITVNLKSLVGINADKNWLPHYVFGSPETGGDQFPEKKKKSEWENILVLWAKKRLLKENLFIQFIARRSKKYAYKVFGDTEKVVRSGNWHGNDTVWRMSIDLNRILLYASGDGTMSHQGQTKRFFSVVDGIVSMEGNGPVAGTRKNTGIIIAGDNPVSVDAVCAKIMGFDYKKMPIIHRSFEKHTYPLIDAGYEDIQPVSNEEKWNRPLHYWTYTDSFQFKPHFGWEGKIEENTQDRQARTR